MRNNNHEDGDREDDSLSFKTSKIQNSMHPLDPMKHKGCLLPQNLNALQDFHGTMSPSSYSVHWYHFRKGPVYRGVDNVDSRHTNQPNDRICHLHSLSVEAAATVIIYGARFVAELWFPSLPTEASVTTSWLAAWNFTHLRLNHV
ncbi:unnamed protein product, partial [Vitis vinifera]